MKNNRKGICKVVICMTLSVCIAMSLPLKAEKIDADKAGKLTQRYVQSKRQLPAGDAVRLKYTATHQYRMNGASVAQPDDIAAMGVQDTVFYYVFDINENAGSGFVIVSGDDAVTPVLGYSENGIYDENNLPPNFAYWLNYLQQQIRWAISQNLPQSEIIRQKWDNYLNGNIANDVASAVSPLISTRWNQNSPYWNQCPIYLGSTCYTGCVATTMAQIMKYHRHPVRGSGQSKSYNTRTRNIFVPSVNFSVDYEWNNMLNSYSGSATTQQRNAVATLMYHCGASVEMDYTPNGSGAYTTNVPIALTSFFGYDKSIQVKYRTYYDDTSWDAILREQIDAGLPVYYAGYGADGHAFACDGYDGNMFHFNWGWGGAYDNYFVTSALTPGTGNRFNDDQEIVVNIKPDAGGVSAGYEIALFDVFSSSVTSVQGNESFTVSAKIKSVGWEEFPGGNLGVALVNQNDQIVETIGTSTSNLAKLPNGYYYPNPFNITCRVPTSVAQGQYKLRAVTRPTGGNWKIISLSSNCPASIDFRVGTAIAVTNVTLNKTSTTLVAGATEQLTATVLPANALNRNVTWNSDNIAVATVSNNGLVTGISAGTANIAVTTQDGGKTENCIVTVICSPPVNVTANIVDNYVAVRWEEPELIGKSANLEGYVVYRFAEKSSEEAWTLLSDHVMGTDYADQGWSALPEGQYQYAVKAKYTGNNLSTAALSNILHKASVKYAVTYSTPVNGTLNVMAGSNLIASGSLIDAGTVLTITATPSAKCNLKTLTVNGNNFTNGGTYTVKSATDIACAFVSSDASLSGILVNNKPASPKPDNATTWEITVDYTIGITIVAMPNHSEARIQESHQGAKTVKTGLNVFEIMVTAENGNKVSYILMVTVKDLPTGIDEHTGRQLAAYPNPVHDRVTIGSLEGNGILTISDASGRLWIQHNITSSEETIDTRSLSAGIYFMQIIEEKRTETIKIIVAY